MTQRDREQFTRHLRAKGLKVGYCVVPNGWAPDRELSGKLWPQVDWGRPSSLDETWEFSFTIWRKMRRVSCLHLPTGSTPWPSRGATLPKLPAAPTPILKRIVSFIPHPLQYLAA